MTSKHSITFKLVFTFLISFIASTEFVFSSTTVDQQTNYKEACIQKNNEDPNAEVKYVNPDGSMNDKSGLEICMAEKTCAAETGEMQTKCNNQLKGVNNTADAAGAQLVLSGDYKNKGPSAKTAGKCNVDGNGDPISIGNCVVGKIPLQQVTTLSDTTIKSGHKTLEESNKRGVTGTGELELCQKNGSFRWGEMPSKKVEERYSAFWEKEFERVNDDKFLEDEIFNLREKISNAQKPYTTFNTKCTYDAILAEITTQCANSSDDACKDGKFAKIWSDKECASLNKEIDEKNKHAVKQAVSYATELLEGEATKIREAYDLTEQCQAAVVITAGADLSIDYSNKNKNGQITKKSPLGFTCYSRGPETLDYAPCASLVDKLSAAQVAEMGLGVYQDFAMKDFSIDQQFALQKDGGQDYKLPLQQQRDAILKQADQMTQRAAMEAGKMALLYLGLEDMPTHQDLIDKCTDGGIEPYTIEAFRSDALIHHIRAKYSALFKDSGINILMTKNPKENIDDSARILPENFAEFFPRHYKADPFPMLTLLDTKQTKDEKPVNHIEGYRESSDKPENYLSLANQSDKKAAVGILLPQTYVTEFSKDPQGLLADLCKKQVVDSGIAYIQNSEARSKIKGLAVKAGIDMARYLLQANILRKQADMINDLLKGIKNFEPIPMTFTGEDLLATLCSPEGFPDHPECQVADPRQVYGFPDQSFDFGGGGSTSTPTISEDIQGGSGEGNVGNSNDRSGPRGFGSTVGKTNKDDGAVRKGAAARVKKGSGGAAGGGGGGGGLLGASAPGGGSNGQGGRSGGSSYSPVKVGGYEGGTKSVGYSGGSLGTRTEKKKDSNPFKNLKGKSEKLDFKSQGIGKKGSNLFQMISSQYGNQTKNLVEYKALD